MAVNYKAELSYSIRSADISRDEIPISSFSVVGGASRTINLNSAGIYIISNELYQAEKYHNITLFMPPTKAHIEIIALVEFTNCAIMKTPLHIWFNVLTYSDGKQTENLQMGVRQAWVVKPPRVVAQSELMIELSLDYVKISYE